VRYESDLKFKDAIECFFVLPCIRVHEVAGVGHLEAVLPEEPLVDLDLPLVSIVPILVERLNFFVLARCFVVNDDEFF